MQIDLKQGGLVKIETAKELPGSNFKQSAAELKKKNSIKFNKQYPEDKTIKRLYKKWHWQSFKKDFA